MAVERIPLAFLEKILVNVCCNWQLSILGPAGVQDDDNLLNGNISVGAKSINRLFKVNVSDQECTVIQFVNSAS